jgi:hypothetical protein
MGHLLQAGFLQCSHEELVYEQSADCFLLPTGQQLQLELSLLVDRFLAHYLFFQGVCTWFYFYQAEPGHDTPT